MKMFVVTWGSAATDHEGTVSGYCGCHGAYMSRSKALKEMQTCLETQKQETIESELEQYSGEPECEEALDYLHRHMVTYGNTVARLEIGASAEGNHDTRSRVDIPLKLLRDNISKRPVHRFMGYIDYYVGISHESRTSV